MNFALRKIFILVVVAVVAVGAGLFLKAQFFRNDAGALAQTACAPLTYAAGKTSTEPVLVNGIANSGQLDFTKADPDIAACAYQGNGGIFIKGLTWNTNWGWMSFEGASNSTIILSDGRVHGETYGTNIGIIKMGCDNGSNFTSSSDCTATNGNKDKNYGVRIAMVDGEDGNANGANCGTMKKGDMYGFAWADTVGWMNFCGAHVDLSVLETPAETPPDTGTTTPPTDTGTNPPYMETYPPELPAYQVARVTGNVKGNIIVDTKNLPFKSWISYPIGDPTSSNREQFLRLAKKSSAELTPDSFDFNAANTKTINAIYLNNISADKNGVYYFKRDKNIQKPCKIIFDDTGEIQYGNITKNPNAQFVTIVSEGCDVYIDHNLRSAYRDQYTDQPKSRLGIIAFSDLSMQGERRGGNVYICSRVTDIESHLVMDGSFFSYGRAEDDCGGADKKDSAGISLVDENSGYPNFENVDIKTLFRNQFVIVGMVLGSNTYGGAVADKPALGTGEIVGTSTEDTAKARLFDVNFLRYANVETRNDPPDGELCWSKNTQLAKYLMTVNTPQKYKEQKEPYPTGMWKILCETNYPIDSREDPQALTNIIYMDPTADLPIFNGMVGKK